jgi:hypothetical protein
MTDNPDRGKKLAELEAMVRGSTNAAPGPGTPTN